jgi:hypothetical protein
MRSSREQFSAEILLNDLQMMYRNDSVFRSLIDEEGEVILDPRSSDRAFHHSVKELEALRSGKKRK